MALTGTSIGKVEYVNVKLVQSNFTLIKMKFHFSSFQERVLPQYMNISGVLRVFVYKLSNPFEDGRECHKLL